jgi:low affinity Fe/Cu permease
LKKKKGSGTFKKKKGSGTFMNSLLSFERGVHALTRWLGSTMAFVLVLLAIGTWFVSRKYFETDVAWQNAIMVTLAILTFLLLFLLQRTQNKALLSIQLKLNEIVASQPGASNRLIDLENLPEAEVDRLHKHFQAIALRAQEEENPGEYHTVEESKTNESHGN